MKYIFIAYIVISTLFLGVSSSLLTRILADKGLEGTLKYIVNGEPLGLVFTHDGESVISIQRIK